MAKIREFIEVFSDVCVKRILYGYGYRARADFARFSLGHNREEFSAEFSAIVLARISLSQHYEPCVTSVRAPVCSTTNLLNLLQQI
jgi:hypothetical protein